MKSDWQYPPRPVARTSGVNCFTAGAVGIVAVLVSGDARYEPLLLLLAAVWCGIGVAMVVFAPVLTRSMYLLMHLSGLTCVTIFSVAAGTTTTALSGIVLQILLVTPAFIVLPSRTARITTFLNAGYVVLLGTVVGDVPAAVTINAVLVVFALAISAAWVQSVASIAEVDELTKLANRRRLHRELHPDPGTRPDGGVRTVAVIDIDDFKTINDELGHAEGDRVLRTMATALRDQFPRKWLVARSGGDEFAVLSSEASTADLADAVKQLRGVLGAEWTVSVGIAGRRPGETPQDVLDRADAALYRSKREGRNCTTVDPEE